MVDTAPSNSFAVLMRKIGFSVGLESTLSRARDLIQLYAERHALTYADWTSLVHDKWGLKNENIKDVFQALGYIQVRNRQISPQMYLDIGAIARTYLQKSDAFEEANKFVLLSAILDADGEIFLNALAADFEKEALDRSLKLLVAYKREQLFSLFPSADVQKRISSVVNIESQPTNKGSSSSSKSLSGTRRKEALVNRTEALSARPISKVEISDDYFRKVLPKRRDWARTLDLYSEKVTPYGAALLEEFSRLGCQTAAGVFVLWPYTRDVSKLRLNPETFQVQALEEWDVSKAIFRARGLDVAASQPTAQEEDEILLKLERMAAIFRDLDRPKAMLRKELPLNVALLSFASVQFGKRERLPDVMQFIEAERKKPNRRFEMRSSRTFLGSLSFPKR